MRRMEAADAAASLPPGWFLVRDKSTGSCYYYHPGTRQYQLMRPSGSSSSSSSSSASSWSSQPPPPLPQPKSSAPAAAAMAAAALAPAPSGDSPLPGMMPADSARASAGTGGEWGDATRQAGKAAGTAAAKAASPPAAMAASQPSLPSREEPAPAAVPAPATLVYSGADVAVLQEEQAGQARWVSAGTTAVTIAPSWFSLHGADDTRCQGMVFMLDLASAHFEPAPGGVVRCSLVFGFDGSESKFALRFKGGDAEAKPACAALQLAFRRAHDPAAASASPSSDPLSSPAHITSEEIAAAIMAPGFADVVARVRAVLARADQLRRATG